MLLCRNCFKSITITYREAKEKFDAEDVDLAVLDTTPYELWNRQYHDERFTLQDVEDALAEAISRNYDLITSSVRHYQYQDAS